MSVAQDPHRIAGAPAGSGSADGGLWRELPLSRAQFVERVRDQGARLYRDLPWRNVDDAYQVLVSEVMLQQTQVARVQRFWPRWLALFPTVDSLAAADTASVLQAWQGLGYNRRALALKRACEECSRERAGRLPATVDELVQLPGIGPATAAGVVAFAHDVPCTYLETNVRSVFLHELFPDEDRVSDARIAPLVAESCPEHDVRGWYYALLDYGAHLKKTVGNPSRRSAGYARQGAFAGSRREKRSFILQQVLASPEGVRADELYALLCDYEKAAGRDAPDPALVAEIADELVAEGFFVCEGDFFITARVGLSGCPPSSMAGR